MKVAALVIVVPDVRLSRAENRHFQLGKDGRMRILVTGGAGYVGSHCLRRLLDAGHSAIVYDNLSRGHKQAVPAGLLVEGDLSDEAKLTTLVLEVAQGKVGKPEIAVFLRARCVPFT